MGKAARYGMALALVAALTTGCLQGDVDVVVHDDGSGVVELVLEPVGELATILAALDIESMADEQLVDVDGADFRVIEDGGNPEYRLRAPFDDHQQLHAFLVDGVTVAGMRVRLLDSLELTEVDDTWRLDAVLAPQVSPVAPDAPIAPGSELTDPWQLIVGARVDLSVALPGSIVHTNADERSGGTATWSLDGSEGTDRLTMETEPTPFPTTLQIVLMAGGAAVLLGLVLALVSRHRSRARWARRTIDLRVPVAPPPAAGNYSWSTTPKQPSTSGVVDLRPVSGRPGGLPSIDGSTSAETLVAPQSVRTTEGESEPEHADESEAAELHPEDEVSSPFEADEAADVAAVDARSGAEGEAEAGVEVDQHAPAAHAPAGWYDDPEGDGSRWWNGHEWTDLRC